jgi:hypothetical protein
MNIFHINPGIKKSCTFLFFYSLFLLFTIIPIHASLYAQKLVRDSILVSFENPLLNNALKIPIDSIQDLRNESPRTIGKYEVTKFLLIPVDLDICTEKPLRIEILEALNLSTNRSSLPKFRLFINEFNLSKNSGSWLFPRYLLNATFQVFWHQSDSAQFIGEILYEIVGRPAIFGGKLKTNFQKVINKWQQKFVTDLNTISNSLNAYKSPRLENLRTDIYTLKSTNLYGGISYIRYPNSHVIDGEMFFSHREAWRCFIRTGGYQIRFRNADDFESISFGLSRDYLFYRLSRDFVFKGKSQLMLGINRWKDIKNIDHEIYDALIFEYVLGQNVSYNVLDKHSILFGFGLQENVFYIYSKDWQFKIGFFIHLGIKL